MQYPLKENDCMNCYYAAHKLISGVVARGVVVTCFQIFHIFQNLTFISNGLQFLLFPVVWAFPLSVNLRSKE